MAVYFFFQAEDGIRDLYVTGVQTCALPISDARVLRTPAAERVRRRSRAHSRSHQRGEPRSEERRVGKECRSRRSPYYQKKKKWSSGAPICPLPSPSTTSSTTSMSSRNPA